MGFLDGIRIVDATRLLPGDFCTMLLADMGAEVIKVEQPGLGDYLRAAPPTRGGRSTLHSTVNRNKLSIGVDLKKPQGKDIMRRLLHRADALVEGFRPGAMSRLGFSYGAVRKINPKIVYCSITGYGQESDFRSVAGHDINFQALAGSLAYPSSAEVPLVQLGDLTAGMYAALGILGALVGKKRPVRLDVPVVASLLSFMVVPASAYLATGHPPTPGQSLIFGSTPYYRLYSTSDGGHMAVGALEEGFWRNLLKALGVPEMSGMRFGTPRERQLVEQRLTRIFATKTRDEWTKLLMRRETCTTPVLTVEEALASGWGKSLSMLVAAAGEVVLNGPLKSKPALRSRPFTRAPSLGADTGALMKFLGYSKSQAAALKAEGAIE